MIKHNTPERVLWILHSEDGLSRVELQKLLGVSQSTVCAALRRLARCGLVRSELDLRAVRLPDGRIRMHKTDIFFIAPFVRGKR